MGIAVTFRVAAVSALSALVFSATPVAQQAKQPAVNPAALRKLAEPWPSAEDMAARRLAAERRPLFTDADIFPITITADFKSINKDRKVEGKTPFQGTLTVPDASGAPKPLKITLRTRGHFRLRQSSCSFVPLRVEFSDDVKGTMFEGQKSLKLITHCQNEKAYEQFTMREYLVYRVFNLLTPQSFRARLTRSTYVQSADGKPMTTRLAMFLEDDDDVARRMDGRIMEIPRALFKDVDADLLTLSMIFQYMIGNTDYSIYALHNFRLVRTQGNRTYTVPYDFDMSGLVNASYAIPDRVFGLKTVRDRLYRGPCRTAEELEPILSRFREKKGAILALYDSIEELDKDQRRDAREYLDEFFRTIDRPNDVRRLFINGQCTTKPTM
jgi:hypothetical protein